MKTEGLSLNGRTWTGVCFEPVFGAYAGVQNLSVHDPDACTVREVPCCLHWPTVHGMSQWPMQWRGDRGQMERVCPHGQGHPDPDDVAYQESEGVKGSGMHGCDGCCYAVLEQ